MKIILANAGYREKSFVKSKLALLGKADHYTYALTHYLYDPYSDEIITDTLTRWKVEWEGSESRNILSQFGLDDANC